MFPVYLCRKADCQIEALFLSWQQKGLVSTDDSDDSNVFTPLGGCHRDGAFVYTSQLWPNNSFYVLWVFFSPPSTWAMGNDQSDSIGLFPVSEGISLFLFCSTCWFVSPWTLIGSWSLWPFLLNRIAPFSSGLMQLVFQEINYPVCSLGQVSVQRLALKNLCTFLWAGKV